MDSLEEADCPCTSEAEQAIIVVNMTMAIKRIPKTMEKECQKLNEPLELPNLDYEQCKAGRGLLSMMTTHNRAAHPHIDCR